MLSTKAGTTWQLATRRFWGKFLVARHLLNSSALTTLVLASAVSLVPVSAGSQTVTIDGGGPVASPLDLVADTFFTSIVLDNGAVIQAADPLDDLVVQGGPSTIDVTGTGTISADITAGAGFDIQVNGSGGTGTLVLSGVNTHGITTLSAGTLSIQNNVAIGSSLVAVDGTTVDFGNGISQPDPVSITGTVNFNQTGGTASQSGPISGTGALNKTGSGILEISSPTNSFSGGTTVSAGVLDLVGVGALPSTTINITGGELQTNGGGLAAGATITQTGGTFDINGNETITTLDNQAGNADVAFGATFGATTINNGNGAAFSAQFSSAGTVNATTVTNNGGVIVNSGTFGTNTLTNNANGLITNSGNLNSATQIDNNAGATLTSSGTVTGGAVNDGTINGAGTFNGAITNNNIFNVTNALLGNGAFTNAATLNVTGGSFTGLTSIANSGTATVSTGQNLGATTFTQSAGAFVVNGTFTGTTTINGGNLSGVGTLNGAVSINNGGTFAPGNSIGTTNVNGNLTFDPGSTYQVEVNPNGTSDLITATGTATINGGTVAILPEAGTYADATTYTILTATGGVTGQFDTTTIDANFAFLTPTLSADPNNIFLELRRAIMPDATPVSFASVAETRNQRNLGLALDNDQIVAGSELQEVINEIIVQSPQEARNSYEDLDGEVHAAGISANMLALQNVVGTIVDEVSASGIGPGSNGGSQFGARTNASIAAAYAAVDGANDSARKAAAVLAADAALERRQARRAASDNTLEINDPVTRTYNAGIVSQPPADDKRFAAWLRGFGAFGEIEDDGNGSVVDHWSAGMLAGIEGKVTNEFAVGATLGYLSTHAEIPNQEFDTDGVIGALTLRYEHASGYGFALVGGAAHQGVETGRRITVGGFSAIADADYDATSAFVSGEMFLKRRFANAVLKPFVGMDAIFTETEAFTETGAGGAGLTNNGENYASVVGRVGVAMSAAVTTGGGTTLVPSLSLAYAHDFGDTTSDATFSFVGGTAGFVTAAAERGAHRFETKAGLAAQLTDRVTVMTTLGGVFSGDDTTGAATGRVRVAF